MIGVDYNINLNNTAFTNCISGLINDNNITEIIETGTFNGLGSTTVFAKTGIPVISIESCKKIHLVAKENLKQYKNVKLLYGSSLKINEMIEFINNDTFYDNSLIKENKIKIDGTKDFYINEVTGWGSEAPEKENLLFDLINNENKQLIFLDSAGGVGYLEFLKFMSLPLKYKKHKVLLLDDVLHIKHYRSILHLKRDKHNVIISQDNRFAYCKF